MFCAVAFVSQEMAEGWEIAPNHVEKSGCLCVIAHARSLGIRGPPTWCRVSSYFVLDAPMETRWSPWRETTLSGVRYILTLCALSWARLLSGHVVRPGALYAYSSVTGVLLRGCPAATLSHFFCFFVVCWAVRQVISKYFLSHVSQPGVGRLRNFHCPSWSFFSDSVWCPRLHVLRGDMLHGARKAFFYFLFLFFSVLAFSVVVPILCLQLGPRLYPTMHFVLLLFIEWVFPNGSVRL